MDKSYFETYIKGRYQNEVDWYNKKSIQNKKIYEILQITIIVSTIITPVLIVLELTIEHNLAYISLIFSVIVAISASFLRTFKFHENWINYRSVCETLKKEIHLYNASAEKYFNIKDPELLFVERIESLISREHTSWVSSYHEDKKSQEDLDHINV
jgi:hypothetical protein